MLRAILSWLLKNATFRLYVSPSPIGRRLGGFDITGIPDNYIILYIEVSGQVLLVGHFQVT